MPKPNQNSSVKEMKDYIRSKKLNHPLIRLGLKKAELVSGLKKLGHWDEVAKVKKTRAKKAKGSFNVKNTSPSQVKGSSKKPEKKKVKPSQSKFLQQKGPGSGGKITKKPALNTKKITPKKKSVDKDSFLDVLSVMGEVAKSKGKSTKKEIDNKVALDKKAQKGKLTNKDFKELMFDDDKTSETIYDFEENLSEGQEYSMGYWISRVSKRADDFDDLTDSQQQRLYEIMQRDIHIQTRKKMKSFYDESVKGKKFKSLKELKDLFIDKYAEAYYEH